MQRMSSPTEYPPPHMPTTQLSTPQCPQWRQPQPPAKRSRRESTSWRNRGPLGEFSLRSKSQAMTISRHRIDWPIPPVAFKGLMVADVDTLKLLGVTFDRHLHCGQHWEPLLFVLPANWLPEEGIQSTVPQRPDCCLQRFRSVDA